MANIDMGALISGICTSHLAIVSHLNFPVINGINISVQYTHVPFLRICQARVEIFVETCK